MERHILTVDVEDNFTNDELKNKSDWLKYESQVVDNTFKILEILNKYNTKGTFFVVGNVVERHPEIIEFIIKRGHEIASHSYYHMHLSSLTLEQIEEDIMKSSNLIYSICGIRPYGYRAMGFSLNTDIEFNFYNLLKKYGFKYDSSRKYGKKTVEIIHDLFSINPSYVEILNKKLLFSGGTYLRLLPIRFIEYCFESYRRRNEPVMLYIHPWEFNKDQPKRNVPLKQKILQSPVTFTTEKKLEILLNKYKFTSIKDYLGL